MKVQPPGRKAWPHLRKGRDFVWWEPGGEAERSETPGWSRRRSQLTQAMSASLTQGGQEPGRGWPVLCWEGGPHGLKEAAVGAQPSPCTGNWCCERPRPSETRRRAGADGGISGHVLGSGQAVFWTLEPTATPWEPSSAEATLGTAGRRSPGARRPPLRPYPPRA